MLDSLFGVNLILWMGSTIPLPAPYDVSAALQSVEVTNDANGGDGFSMTFTLGKTGLGEYGLMQSGALDMFNRVIIGVMIGAMPSALIDGIITHHQITPSDQPGKSTLTVMGRDVSVMLDLEEKNVPYENQPDFLIVMRLIAGYAQFGLVPQVTPTTDVPIFLERIPRQNETDLKFIKKLAEKNGFVFYIEPLTFGVNTAYWGPENRLSLPQSAINVDLGSHTNVRGSLHFSNDGCARVASSACAARALLTTASTSSRALSTRSRRASTRRVSPSKGRARAHCSRRSFPYNSIFRKVSRHSHRQPGPVDDGARARERARCLRRPGQRLGDAVRSLRWKRRRLFRSARCGRVCLDRV